MFPEKLARTICCLFFYLPAFCQAKQAHTDLAYTVVAYRKGAAIEYLNGNKTYKLLYPAQLNYHKAKENKSCWEDLNLIMDAKKARDGGVADKTFEIVTNGLLLNEQYEDIEMPMAGNAAEKGWVRKIYFSFPLKIVARDAADSIEKEMLLCDASQELPGIFHAEMLEGNKKEGERSIVPFSSKEKMQAAYDANKAAILKRCERNQALKFCPQIERAIYAAYDFNRFERTQLWTFSIRRNEQTNYAGLFKFSEKLKICLAEMQDEAIQDSIIDIIAFAHQFYKKQLEKKDVLPDDIVKLSLYNGAMAALVSGNLQDADAWYAEFCHRYTGQGYAPTMLEINFKNLFDVFAPYYQLKQSAALQVIMHMEPGAAHNGLAATPASNENTGTAAAAGKK